jgi:hypothetical protein
MFANQEFRIVIPLWHVAKVLLSTGIIEFYFFGLAPTLCFNGGLVLA